MKTIKLLTGIAVAATLIFGCREIETKNVSFITNFADFTMEGEPTMFIEVGEPYTEPGVSAEEGGEQLEVTTAISGTYFVGGVSSINTAVADKYTINYTAFNSDGYPGKVTRTVYVVGKGDLVNDISGLYTSTVERNGESAAEYNDMEYVIIAKTGDDTYELSDAIGGYYDLGRSYGADYAASGIEIIANDISANDFTLPSDFGVGVFGGAAEITNMTVDAVAGTIEFTTEWQADASTTYTFVTTLKQVEF